MRTIPGSRALGIPALLSLGLGLCALSAGAIAQDPKPGNLREQAYGAENRGDFAAAADAFLKLVEREPANATWVVAAGRCLGRSGRFADAIDLLDGARGRFAGAIDVPAMLARTYLLKGERDRGALNPQLDYAEAATLAEGVLQLEPNHEDCRLILAQARYLLGEWDEAVRQAEEAVRRHPRRPGAHILRGRIATDNLRRLLVLHENGGLAGQPLADLVGAIADERESAIAAFTAAAQLDPSRAHPHVMLARIALLENKTEVVRRHLLDALAIDPDDGFVDHARIAEGLDWSAVRKVYAEVRARYEARPDAVPAKAATLRWYEGRALFDGRQWAAARAAFEAVLAADPDATNSHYYAALSAYELGDHDGAEQHAGDFAAVSAVAFADVIRSLPAEARGQVGAIVRYLGDRAYQRGDKARSRDLNHVTALLYDTADAWNNRAFLCRETGKFADALAAYRRALEKEPTSPQLNNDTAVILHYHLPGERNLQEARQLYHRAIGLADKVLADSAATAAAKAAARQAKSDAQANLAEMK